MIELREIKVLANLKKYIRIGYSGDNDLLTKFHVAEYSLDEAVDDEINRVEVMSKSVPVRYFGVIKGVDRIGYVCIFPNNLYSFCINIKYRNKEVLSDFWSKIKEVLGNSFICMLYENNIRAIKWLKKNGMVEVDGVTDFCITLLNVN